MKILIDCSNLQAGGGIQVALSFINDLIKLNRQERFIILMSPQIALSLKEIIHLGNFQFIELNKKYYKNIFVRGRIIKKIESEIRPNIIFTVFGPSYHKSNFPKIVGFGIGHILYPKSPYFKKIDSLSRFKINFVNSLKKHFFIKNSDALIFETEDAKQIFSNKIDQKKKCYTVSNTLNEIFLHPKRWSKRNFKIDKTFNVLYLTANYPHKNLSIIPDIIGRILETTSIRDFKFVLSVNKNDLKFPSEYNSYIEYLGKVSIEEVPSLYEQVDILFMPTLLEIFSTSYLEAMYMKKAIVSSDMSFARDICGEAAIFCSPLSIVEYSDAIIELYQNKILRNDLIEKGMINLERFGNSMDRTNSYLEIIKKYSLNENS